MNKKKLLGSGILAVILATIVFVIYSSSAYLEQEHFRGLQKKYEDSMVSYYQKDLNDIETVYDNLIGNEIVY